MKYVKPEVVSQLHNIKEMLNRMHTEKQDKPPGEILDDDMAREIIRRLRIQNKKLMNQMAKLKDRLANEKVERQDTLRQMNNLTRINHSLASALGACRICWGEDPECAACKGNGVPGWTRARLNKRMFNKYVLPVLDRMYGLTGKIKG